MRGRTGAPSGLTARQASGTDAQQVEASAGCSAYTAGKVSAEDSAILTVAGACDGTTAGLAARRTRSVACNQICDEPEFSPFSRAAGERGRGRGPFRAPARFRSPNLRSSGRDLPSPRGTSGEGSGEGRPRSGGCCSSPLSRRSLPGEGGRGWRIRPSTSHPLTPPCFTRFRRPASPPDRAGAPATPEGVRYRTGSAVIDILRCVSSAHGTTVARQNGR